MFSACAIVAFCIVAVSSSGDVPQLPSYSEYEVKGVQRVPSAGMVRPFHLLVGEEGRLARLTSYDGLKTEIWKSLNDSFSKYDYTFLNYVSKNDDLNERVCYTMQSNTSYSAMMVMPHTFGDFKFCCEDAIDFGNGSKKYNKYEVKNTRGTSMRFWTSLKGDIPVRFEIEFSPNGYEQTFVDFTYFTKKAPSVRKIMKPVARRNCTLLDSDFTDKVNADPEDPEEDTAEIDQHFEAFKQKHGKIYADAATEALRKRIFAENFRMVQESNRAGKSYRLAINGFSDLTEAEMFHRRGLLPLSKRHKPPVEYTDEEVYGEWMNKTLPDHWDWRLHGVVSPVKDQNMCGSCWSFGATGAMEGALALKNNATPPRLSQQELMDCSWEQDNSGCMGGYQSKAFEYAIKYGIATENDYGSYLGVEGKCKRKEVKPTVRVTKYGSVRKGDPDALKRALMNKGPITVGVEVGKLFEHYSSGVLDGSLCDGDRFINHAVLVVGFGKQDGKEYFLVKNSWGPAYGLDGFVDIVSQVAVI